MQTKAFQELSYIVDIRNFQLHDVKDYVSEFSSQLWSNALSVGSKLAWEFRDLILNIMQKLPTVNTDNSLWNSFIGKDYVSDSKLAWEFRNLILNNMQKISNIQSHNPPIALAASYHELCWVDLILL